MKKIYLFIICTTTSLLNYAQLGQTISVNSKHILGPCGDTLILRGVNYAPYNWGWSPTQLNVNQIAQSGANTVRLVWYKNPTGATPISTYGNLTNLDSAISKTIQQKMIPIVSLHDQTCQNDPNALINLATWFTQSAMLTIINKYKHSLILNIANEALYVSWTGNPAAAQTTFTTTYSTIVNNLRTAGITVPLLIDGPECGTNLDVLASVGNTLQTNDSQHNLIFSAHAYWYGYANNDSTIMLSKINNALAQNIPFIFGEIANLQDDNVMCQYNLNYRALLNICKTKKLGWIAWSWDNDGCSARQVTTAGNFSSLTTYGNDIINNTNFGLLTNPPTKSHFLINKGCLSEVKLFLEGYYLNNQLMRNVLNLQGVTTVSNLITDTIVVSLHQVFYPYAQVQSCKGLLNTNGKIACTFPSSVIGQSYYIKINHRNTITTWSASPIVFGFNTKYDFTNVATKAFGSNQKLLSTGVYGFYSGDINQDGIIDNDDYTPWETDANNFASGYLSTDLNGDGAVDNGDYIFWEVNSNNFVGVVKP